MNDRVAAGRSFAWHWIRRVLIAARIVIVLTGLAWATGVVERLFGSDSTSTTDSASKIGDFADHVRPKH